MPLGPSSRFSVGMNHLALAVSDQERSRRFYEVYLGFDARPPRRYDDDVLMLYNGDGFSLALGPAREPIRLPAFLHFGVHLPSPGAVRALRDRLGADGVGIVAESDEPDYVSVKFLDPDGYVIEAAWEPHLREKRRGGAVLDTGRGARERPR
jgi:catechol 2,3-dioxygenase-like lactoylglutathione lyase family enzyme